MFLLILLLNILLVTLVNFQKTYIVFCMEV